MLLLCIVIFLSGVCSAHSSTIYNAKYGADPSQNMDIYLPSNKSIKDVKAIIVLIHGGAWFTGSKKYMEPFIVNNKKYFPQYAIVNMEYRLATIVNPGYPKQIDDVGAAINYLKGKAGQAKFVLVGGSAGAHLAMLYAYARDAEQDVKVVVNFVGPVDLTEWNLSSKFICNLVMMNFVGAFFYWHHPGIYYTCSPIAWVTSSSPKTIGFYGDSDPIIPLVQGTLLKNKLDQAKVVNEFYTYHGGHGNWTQEDMLDAFEKSIKFIEKYI